jgi:hypothetical protein
MRWVQPQPVSQASGEDPVSPIARRVRSGGVEYTVHIDQDQRPAWLHPSTIRFMTCTRRSSTGCFASGPTVPSVTRVQARFIPPASSWRRPTVSVHGRTRSILGAVRLSFRFCISPFPLGDVVWLQPMASVRQVTISTRKPEHLPTRLHMGGSSAGPRERGKLSERARCCPQGGWVLCRILLLPVTVMDV